MTTKEQLEIITAFINGGMVERREHGSWEPIRDQDHEFNFEKHDYRLRVEPPSEEEALTIAWRGTSIDCTFPSFMKGWEAAKRYFTQP